MATHVSTVAFAGIEARPVDVQVQISSGAVAFAIVGLVDKAPFDAILVAPGKLPRHIQAAFET